jgi:hypothetical protein
MKIAETKFWITAMKRLYFYIFFCIVIIGLGACNSNSNKTDNLAVETEQNTNEHSEITEHSSYFDYQNTYLNKAILDTTYAHFSDDTIKDCFTLLVPEGKIVETISSISINSEEGTLLYEHHFPSWELINGYELANINTTLAMEEYIQSKALAILKDGIIHPNHLSSTNYLNLAKPEDFDDYDAFITSKKSARNIFIYVLQEENHFYLVYSENLKKVVRFLSCC